MLPLIGLLLISIAISLTGDYVDQQATLLAIYLVYGSFSLIITEKTINPNVINIADVLNLSGITVAFLHFINIIFNSGLSIKED